MNRLWRSGSKTRKRVAAFALLASVLGAGAASAADGRAQLGDVFYSFETPTKAKKAGELKIVANVANDFEGDEPLFLQCSLSAGVFGEEGFEGTKGVRIVNETSVYLLDRRSGEFSTFDLSSSIMTTDRDGFANDSIDFPTAAQEAIFTDGFESGDVSALLVSEARVTKGKKIESVAFGCTLFGNV